MMGRCCARFSTEATEVTDERNASDDDQQALTTSTCSQPAMHLLSMRYRCATIFFISQKYPEYDPLSNDDLTLSYWFLLFYFLVGIPIILER